MRGETNQRSKINGKIRLQKDMGGEDSLGSLLFQLSFFHELISSKVMQLRYLPSSTKL